MDRQTVLYRNHLAGLLCLAIFHVPDGREIRIDTAHISAVRSVEGFGHHVAPGTKAIISVNSQTFGVIETPEQVEAIIEECN